MRDVSLRLLMSRSCSQPGHCTAPSRAWEAGQSERLRAERPLGGLAGPAQVSFELERAPPLRPGVIAAALEREDVAAAHQRPGRDPALRAARGRRARVKLQGAGKILRPPGDLSQAEERARILRLERERLFQQPPGRVELS